MTTAKAKAAPAAADKTAATDKTSKKEAADLFAFPAFDVPPAMRDFVENSLMQSKDSYDKFKVTAEETTVELEKTIEKTRNGVMEFNSKAIEAVQENTDATLSHVKDVFAVKSLAEVLELQTAFVKKQMDVMQAQAETFKSMTTKLSEETSEPYQAAFQKSVEAFKVA